jgi:hypothetical protein
MMALKKTSANLKKLLETLVWVENISQNWRFGDTSMGLQCFNSQKSLQVCAVYPIRSTATKFVSNPNWTTLNRRGR